MSPEMKETIRLMAENIVRHSRMHGHDAADEAIKYVECKLCSVYEIGEADGRCNQQINQFAEKYGINGMAVAAAS